MGTINREPIVAVEVPGRDRMKFLPDLFGKRLMLVGESLVYVWAKGLCDTYTGGFWKFFRLSNGGLYMAPSRSERMTLVVEGNGFEGDFGSDAAGIVITLYALNQLMWDVAAAKRDCSLLVDRYHALREFASGHDECDLILSAID
jgi:hypothetical protein